MREVRLLITKLDDEYLESVLDALNLGLRIYGSGVILAEVRDYGSQK